jgi:hypothetical protein
VRKAPLKILFGSSNNALGKATTSEPTFVEASGLLIHQSEVASWFGGRR